MIANRIDSMSTNPDGSINLEYTTGDFPIPGAASGVGTQFNSIQHMHEQVDAAEQTLAQILHLITLSRFLKTDPNYLNKQAPVGHGNVVDLTGIGQVILPT